MRHANHGCGLQIWDMMTYLVMVLLSLLVFAAYSDRATTGTLQQLLGSFTLFLLYGTAVIPLGYAYSFGFASPSAAQACCFSFDTHSFDIALNPADLSPCVTDIICLVTYHCRRERQVLWKSTWSRPAGALPTHAWTGSSKGIVRVALIA